MKNLSKLYIITSYRKPGSSHRAVTPEMPKEKKRIHGERYKEKEMMKEKRRMQGERCKEKEMMKEKRRIQ